MAICSATGAVSARSRSARIFLVFRDIASRSFPAQPNWRYSGRKPYSRAGFEGRTRAKQLEPVDPVGPHVEAGIAAGDEVGHDAARDGAEREADVAVAE